MNALIQYLSEGQYEQARELFAQSDASQQIKLLEELGEELQSKSHLAIQSPNVVVTLTRKLHEGKTFEDFYEAWKPPVPCLETKGHKHIYNYFGLPTRVINAQNMQDPTDILSIGMQVGESEAQFMEELKVREQTEALRAGKIKEVAVKTDNKLYFVMSDDILGF